MKQTEADGETIRTVVDRQAEERRSECFLIEPQRDEALSFAECRSAVFGLALRLRNLGAVKGEKVACVANNGRLAVEFILGALYGGQVAVMLNGAAGSSWLLAALEHSNARIVFTDEAHRCEVNKVIRATARPPVVIEAESVPRILDAHQQSAALPLLSADDDGLLVYTSGSTGRPKGVLVSHRSLLAGGRNSVEAHQLTSRDRSLCVLPLYHMNAQVVTLMSTLLSGGSLVVPERFQAHLFWDIVERFRCTWFALAPAIVSQLVQNAMEAGFGSSRVPESVRFARCSSAPLSPKLHQRFEELFHVPLIEAMGSTEAGGAIFSNPLPPASRKLGSPGLPVGFEVRVVDDAGVKLPVGQIGEILVRGPSVMKGYYKEPAATAEVLDPNGWLRTGDLGFCDLNGYFTIIGRSKEIIIKGGENIAPREIDEVLLAHPSVLEAATVGLPDVHFGEEIIAFVTLKAEEEFREAELLAWCRGKLGSIKTPCSIVPVESLPRGPTGKVLRKELAARAQALSLAEHASILTDPLAIERLVIEVWEQVLRLHKISPLDNFFKLGGHSLLAMEILIRLCQRLGTGFSTGFFVEHPTPARQAAAIIETLKKRGLATKASLEKASPRFTERRTIPLRDRSTPCPLSPAQQRIWIVEQLHPRLPLHVESQAVRIHGGGFDANTLEAALNAMVARHEMLRTAIRVNTDGTPAQFPEAGVTIRLRRICSHDEAQLHGLLDGEVRQPFDLTMAPLLRVTLIETGAEDHVLLIVLHHIACDGYSFGVFFHELSVAYRELIVGNAFTPPPLSIQYGDYAAWKYAESRQAGVEQELPYWKSQLRDVPRLVNWQIDSPRPAHNDYQGARIPLQIAPDLTGKLRILCQEEGISLFTLMLAAFEVLIHRSCGQEKFLLGIPFADRDIPELASLIGCLVDVLIVRADLSPNMSFREHVRHVDEKSQEMHKHRAMPFERLVQELGVERSLSHEPLLQVMLNWRTPRLERLQLEGLDLSPVPVHNGMSKFDLALFLFDSPGGLEGEIEYRTQLFGDDSIRRMTGHFETLLKAIVDEPDCKISRLPLLTLSNREEIIL